MLDSDLWITIFKFLGAILACALGVVALYGEFRDAHGRLTKWGRATLAGLIFALIVGVCGAFIENSKARNDSKEQAQRTEVLLKEVSRAVQPLDEISLYYSFEIDGENKIVKKYIEYIDNEILKNFSKIDDLFYMNKIGLNVTTRGLVREPITIDVSRKGKYWPHGETKDLAIALSILRPSLSFYRNPLDPNDFYLVRGAKAAPDLMTTNFDLENLPGISYNFKEKKLYVTGQIEFLNKLQESNGKISAVPDLYGSQMIVSWSFLDISKYNKFYSKFTSGKAIDIVKDAQIFHVSFGFGNGRKIWIAQDKFLRTVRQDTVFNSFVLPKDDMGMQKMNSL